LHSSRERPVNGALLISVAVLIQLNRLDAVATIALGSVERAVG